MLSRWLPRVGGILLLSLAVTATASAQYGGGGSGGSGGSGSSGSGSSGYGSGTNGKAIGIGVGAGAAVVVGIALYVHHRHKAAAAATSSKASVIGCTQSEINGISLKNENDEQTYMIISSDSPLQVGQRVELTGVVTDQDPGTRTFRVQAPIRSFGTCGASLTAVASKAPAQQQ